MKYLALSFKNQKLLRELRNCGDKRLDFTNKNFPNYKEADIYELIECGYLRCEFPKGHVRTYDDNWNFVGFITYKGHTYYRGRLKEYFKGIGQLGGWIALIQFIFELINNMPEILKVFSYLTNPKSMI